MDRKREIIQEISELYREIEELQQELALMDEQDGCEHEWEVDYEFLLDYPKATKEDAKYCTKCGIDKVDVI